VEEDNGITATLIDIGHACTVDLDALQGEREIGGDGLAHDGSFGPPAAGQRQEVAQGGDEIAPTVDVGVAAVVGGHALDLRHGRQLRVQDRQIGLPGDGRGAGSNDFRSWRSPTRTSNWAAASVALRITFRLPPDSPTSRPAACRRSEPSADFSIF